ncbi:hypothetical protein PDPUS_1_01784 [Photobacterium damselae subsp. piscicida]|uniref:Uncharacterized protein n=1 Tax=Photobacterium damsela subsp. piscicida TaxID=38294 RepID=A0A1V1VCI5_PHODP|nr:hypothetical protein [Photobacterium damselae]MBE8129127.1 hypothetical protein [Photobacterium damselae subsp. piscicida]MDP2532658.1 hypothetical protein [Photobacterium damselae subsp. piscicida]MDP2558705.1 hypothetical protein [Photobacterium damselae subsp. piscicida]MDP2569503.1 hypothetical protein [Photobacterium damselae subsp. piscicida]PSW75767.1 hypothetical protein CTT37_17865 [Photobacterium damselae]
MTPSLNLTYAPNVLFLFGLSGAGKSYVGDVIGQHSGWHVYHADEDLTQEMVVTPIDLLMVKFTFYKRSNNLIVHLFAFRKTNGFSY